MNKKLLFGMMSLATLAACTNDDFQSQSVVAEETSPVQFEVINSNDAFTRAYMEGNTIHWEASEGDLFTLYHGGTVATSSPFDLTAFQNATYTAVEGDGAATLTTPSMILSGSAIMVWPVDTAFTNDGSAALAISIPEVLDNIENNITYASDVVDIKSRVDGATPATYSVGDPNTAGYNRKYPVYMRPLTSQLTIKADYAGTEATIAELYTGENAIDPIKVTSVDLQATTAKFTTKIPLAFTAETATETARWDAAEPNNSWSHVTGFATTASADATKLTTKVLTGNESAKFLILPQASITTADATSAVVVNTIYGKVTIGSGSSYSTTEAADAWYKMSGTTKTDESTVADGMMSTLNAISTAKVSANNIVMGEPTGAAATRYVKVLLNYLDMSDLHITTDKQLRDAARVWQHLGAASDVTVYLDGDDDGDFAISKQTIAAIYDINAAVAGTTGKVFKVMPCTVAGEACSTIVITGGGDVPENLDFIVANSATKADVALNEGETWKWADTVTVGATSTGIKGFINRGTMTNAETATLAIYDNAATPSQVFDIPFENAAGATWNITAGDLNVQFNVTNNGIVNISDGAEYLQDGQSVAAKKTTFLNEATTLEERFVLNDPSISADDKAAFVEKIGKVNNSGVFATVGDAEINNYGLIEHKLASAKTYVTRNMTTTAASFTNDADYASAFNAATSGAGNKMGRINLPYGIRSSADNVSISAALTTGFVSLTVDGEITDGKLNFSAVGGKVNYVIVNSGITTITEITDKIKYLEINQPGTEIAWQVDATKTATYDGLIVLSPVNIKTESKVKVNKATYLGEKMYVGGTFTNGSAKYNGYYGNTTANEATMYRTY